MEDRTWWAFYVFAWVIVVVLWFTAPMILWKIELLFRAGLTIVAVVIIIAWGIYRHEHVPSMTLS